jgi:hypothetical protein
MKILLYALKIQAEILLEAYQQILDKAKNYVEPEIMVAEMPEYASALS